MSPSAKSVDASDNVNVIVAVSPAFNSETSEVILIVGTTALTVTAIASESIELFPAASVAVTEKELSPFSNAIKGLIENIPVISSAVVVIPVVTPSTNKVTVLPASAIPSIVGVASFVSAVVVVISG